MNLIFILIGHISSMDTPRYAPPEGNTRYVQTAVWWWSTADSAKAINSHGIRIKSHQPFQSVYAALTENKDIESRSELVETERERLMVRNTDTGKKILEDIKGLKMLLQAYREGTME